MLSNTNIVKASLLAVHETATQLSLTAKQHTHGRSEVSALSKKERKRRARVRKLSTKR